MKNKKLIERNLPFTSKYTLLSIFRASAENADNILVCENCNAAIVNFADIQNDAGKKFVVGFDCMETLTKCLTNLSEWQDEKSAFNSALRFYALMQKAHTVKIKNGFIDIAYNENGRMKTKSEFEHNLRRFRFDLTPFEKPVTDRDKQTQTHLTAFEGGRELSFENENGSNLVIMRHNFKNYLYKVIDGERQLMRLISLTEVEKMIDRFMVR